MIYEVKDISGYVCGVCAGVYGCVRRGLRGSPGVCWGVPGYMQVCAGVRGKAGVCPF